MKNKKRLFKLLSLWPPFLGSGIKVRHVADDLSVIDVEMKLRFWNRNYVGTHYGGSLYSMCDPFLMLMLIETLGPEYIVWDKAATIRFKKPGRGAVRVRFELPKAQVDEIRKQAQEQVKVEPTFYLKVLDKNDEVIAEVDKLLYVKKKVREQQQ